MVYITKDGMYAAGLSGTSAAIARDGVYAKPAGSRCGVWFAFKRI